MQKQIMSVLILALLLLAGAAEAQTQTTTKKPAAKGKTTKGKSKTAAKPKSAPVAITVKLTSKCEKDVMIYAGPKTNLRDPKQRQIGGLSVNMLYLKTGDVVCIMDAKKKPFSCINVTKASTKMEVNPAGTNITVSP
jgi:hypothetical protein